MVLPVSPKVGQGNNCPMLNENDVVPQVRRINRFGRLIKIKSNKIFVIKAQHSFIMLSLLNCNT